MFGYYAAELKSVLEPLAPLGFPVAEWTPSALGLYLISITDFIKNMKMFNTIQDEVVRDDWLALGIMKGFWTEITSCTISGMYNFTRFIQSNDGIELLHDLAKKRGKAYLSLLYLQLSELVLAKKRKRAELGDDIADHELEKNIADVDALFLPASQYQQLDEVTLLERCYQKYLAEATELGMEVLDWEQDLMKTLKVKYGVAVRQDHLHEFMRDKGRRNMIKVWANERTLELGESKEAGIFHQLLAVVC